LRRKLAALDHHLGMISVLGLFEHPHHEFNADCGTFPNGPLAACRQVR
jgi:hypothetical protein